MNSNESQPKKVVVVVVLGLAVIVDDVAVFVVVVNTINRTLRFGQNQSIIAEILLLLVNIDVVVDKEK